MNENITHPLTETAAAELVMKFAPSVAFQIIASVAPDDLTEYARAAFDAGREQGWDEAAQHIYNKGWEGVTALRKANPHRPVQELPPERDGVVLVPADGHKAITTTKGQEFARLTFTTKQDLWYGPNLAARPGDWVIQTTAGDRLTPGTWRAV